MNIIRISTILFRQKILNDRFSYIFEFSKLLCCLSFSPSHTLLRYCFRFLFLLSLLDNELKVMEKLKKIAQKIYKFVIFVQQKVAIGGKSIILLITLTMSFFTAC